MPLHLNLVFDSTHFFFFLILPIFDMGKIFYLFLCALETLVIFFKVLEYKAL